MGTRSAGCGGLGGFGALRRTFPCPILYIGREHRVWTVGCVDLKPFLRGRALFLLLPNQVSTRKPADEAD